jgi:hypothetical protein
MFSNSKTKERKTFVGSDQRNNGFSKINDPVNHPSHYTSGNIEVIDALEDWELNFHRANAVKYIARAGKKDQSKEIEDLEKAIWYLKRNIDLIKKKMITPIKVQSMTENP